MDDRDARAGVMFADCELIGIPHRIVVGDKALEAGQVEYRARGDSDNQMIPLGEIVDLVTQRICDALA
jgi:prolyl-tRNA synthetase